MKKPKPLPNPDFKPLQKICQDYLNNLAKQEQDPDDLEYYIFEIAMECNFGKDVFNYINSKL